MAKKKTPFLDFYKECIKNNNNMPYEGLCICFSYEDDLYAIVRTFTPNDDDRKSYKVHYRSGDSYWGSGERLALKFQFTQFRQTIVLFCAAMNDEL